MLARPMTAVKNSCMPFLEEANFLEVMSVDQPGTNLNFSELELSPSHMRSESYRQRFSSNLVPSEESFSTTWSFSLNNLFNNRKSSLV